MSPRLLLGVGAVGTIERIQLSLIAPIKAARAEVAGTERALLEVLDRAAMSRNIGERLELADAEGVRFCLLRAAVAAMGRA
jgi:hypothetical protein